MSEKKYNYPPDSDVEPHDDQPGELQIVFRAIEGFEPPTAPELEEALEGGDTF